MSVKIFNFLWRVNNFQTTFLIVPPFQYVTGTMKKQDSQSLMDSGLPILLQNVFNKGKFLLALGWKSRELSPMGRRTRWAEEILLDWRWENLGLAISYWTSLDSISYSSSPEKSTLPFLSSQFPWYGRAFFSCWSLPPSTTQIELMVPPASLCWELVNPKDAWQHLSPELLCTGASGSWEILQASFSPINSLCSVQWSH